MREIKLRAWHKPTKKWQYFSLPDDLFPAAYDIGNQDEYDFWENYTGIKDRNGVEIYEDSFINRYGGGILGNPNEILTTGKVVWTTDGYKIKAIKDGIESYGNMYNQSELEVVGDAHIVGRVV